jgi:perosamine synthetase
MEALHRFAKRRELFVIEDMAEAHGVPIHEKSNAACYSFYRNKIIAGEEGGMIYFQDPSHARRARLLRNMGFPTDQSYEHIPRGINGRMSNSHAKLILDSLARVNLNLGKRREIEQWYDKYVPLEYHMPARDVPWVYDLRLRNVNNKPVVSELQKQGIKARLGFLPISAQQEYLGPWKHLVAYEASREVLYLPIETSMTESQVRSIADRLQTAIAKASFQNVDF